MVQARRLGFDAFNSSLIRTAGFECLQDGQFTEAKGDILLTESLPLAGCCRCDLEIRRLGFVLLFLDSPFPFLRPIITFACPNEQTG